MVLFLSPSVGSLRIFSWRSLSAVSTAGHFGNLLVSDKEVLDVGETSSRRADLECTRILHDPQIGLWSYGGTVSDTLRA